MDQLPLLFYDEIAGHQSTDQLAVITQLPCLRCLAPVFEEHRLNRRIFSAHIWFISSKKEFHACFTNFGVSHSAIYAYPLQKSAGLNDKFIRFRELILEPKPFQPDEKTYLINPSKLAFIFQHIASSNNASADMELSLNFEFYPGILNLKSLPQEYLGDSLLYQIRLTRLNVTTHFNGTYELVERIASSGSLQFVHLRGVWNSSIIPSLFTLARKNPLKILRVASIPEISIEDLKELADIWRQKEIRIDINIAKHLSEDKIRKAFGGKLKLERINSCGVKCSFDFAFNLYGF
ncbi:hypothetical protein L596_005794 [Steinernema carpocapsae]|uniref:Uncharacterized protein n=1 Tax=Steinernema carpocapsae TaxID=34508 RepID=A0A4U8V5Z2_STECR|nr:hypothetical protein L596_005794 [Steinernema carpocapsae]